MEGSTKDGGTATGLCGAIEVNEAQIRTHLSDIGRGMGEEQLNAVLEADADRLCGAGRYGRSEERGQTRAGT